jgi:hypothetical protein
MSDQILFLSRVNGKLLSQLLFCTLLKVLYLTKVLLDLIVKTAHYI